MRPDLGPRTGSVGHANVSNLGVNRVANGLGKVAKCAAVLSVAVETYNIASAPAGERGATVARAGGHIFGGVAGGEAGAVAGAAIGSVLPGPGNVIGAVVGGLLGSFAGSEIAGSAAEAIYDWW